MSLKHEFNRIGHLFNGGIVKTQREAGHWAEKGAKHANHLSRQARNRVKTGTRNLVSVEESIARHMQENPALYVFAAALLLGVLIAKLAMESRRVPQPPLL